MQGGETIKAVLFVAALAFAMYSLLRRFAFANGKLTTPFAILPIVVAVVILALAIASLVV